MKPLTAEEIKARVSIEDLLRHYGATLNGKGPGRCLFPQRHNHGDEHPSMSVHEGRVYCYAQACFGDKGSDIFELVGRLEDLSNFPDQKRRVLELAGLSHDGNGRRPPKIVTAYDYTNETGALLFQVVRFEPKDFRQRRPDGQEGWLWNLDGVRLVLYRLPAVVAAASVLIIEGEKDVDTAYQIGLPAGWAATCNPMGAKKWRSEYSESLRGKQVAILPDGDKAGHEHAAQVMAALKGIAASIQILAVPQGHKDLTAWVEAGATAQHVHAILLNPVPVTADSRSLGDTLDEVIALLEQYSLLPASELAVVIACWVALTYCYERVTYCGYLALRSATPRCGKTRLLSLVAVLAKGSPPITTIPSAATLFRRTRAVMILDEVDRLRNADKETFGDVLAVLNGGFQRGMTVERVEKVKGEGFSVKAYDVYGPKALAGIEFLADTLGDRSFQIQMQRAPQRMPRLNLRRLEERTARLRNEFMAWMERHGGEIQATYEQLEDQVPELADYDDRFQDISEPLVVLASLADAERPDGEAVLPRLLDGLKAAAGRREPSGREREFLAFLELAETRMGGTSSIFIPSADLVSLCQDREELARIESGKALAGFLRHFDLYVKSTGTHRGYTLTREWVTHWRDRYGARGMMEPTRGG